MDQRDTFDIMDIRMYSKGDEETYEEGHSEGSGKRSQQHDPPVVPALGVVAEVDDPGGDAHLEGRDHADVRAAPRCGVLTLEQVIAAGDDELAELPCLVVQVPVLEGLLLDAPGEVTVPERLRRLVLPPGKLDVVRRDPPYV